MKNSYDVIIVGGGLAGLTLALQIKQTNSSISILILEKREKEAPEAAHKVGEATAEVGSYYLRKVLNLEKYLDEYHLTKYGLRYFFSPQNTQELSDRVEMGSIKVPLFSTEHIDRGIFENDMVKMLRMLGIDIKLGARVLDVDLSSKSHRIVFKYNRNEFEINSKWVVDATGRGSFLKRKLKLKTSADHKVNAVWFRVKGDIDIGNWSKNKKWRSFLKPGLRRHAVNHLMGEGYWVWIIPLVSGITSFGIVSDPSIHALKEMNSLEKAMNWLEQNEPICAHNLEHRMDDVLDFRSLKHLAYKSDQYYSTDRWGLTGESGVFTDPFYSPGTDLIALANTWLTDLIVRDINGMDISIHASAYENMHKFMVEGYFTLLKNKYPIMGNSQIMVMKVLWDSALYWGTVVPVFTNNYFTDLRVMQEIQSFRSHVERNGRINQVMQRLFNEWAGYDGEVHSNRYFDLMSVDFLKKIYEGIQTKLEPMEFVDQYKTNFATLEKLAAEIIRRVSGLTNKTPLNMKVDPYTMSLAPDETGSLENADSFVSTDETISRDIDKVWFRNLEGV